MTTAEEHHQNTVSYKPVVLNLFGLDDDLQILFIRSGKITKIGLCVYVLAK